MNKKTIVAIIIAGGLVVLLAAGALVTEFRMKNAGIGPIIPAPVATGATLPPFSGITHWFNTENGKPITPADLAGKVVLVDFWTYSCINCIRTLPYLTEWHERYADKGLVIVGVHTPEFAFEADPENVADALTKHGINYPVALDPEFATWNSYNNHYWPAKYLFDGTGKLAYTHFGEGEYAQTELEIQRLLTARGQQAVMPVADKGTGPDFASIGTPETYLGYSRAEGYAHAITPDKNTAYTSTQPGKNEVTLEGTWRVEDERAVSTHAGSKMRMQFSARTAHLVMGAPGTAVRLEVRLDGAAVPMEARPEGMFEENGKTYITVSGKDLYTLIDRHGPYAAGTLELEWDGPVECYAFTFG